jgi:hypothetical protein
MNRLFICAVLLFGLAVGCQAQECYNEAFTMQDSDWGSWVSPGYGTVDGGSWVDVGYIDNYCLWLLAVDVSSTLTSYPDIGTQDYAYDFTTLDPFNPAYDTYLSVSVSGIGGINNMANVTYTVYGSSVLSGFGGDLTLVSGDQVTVPCSSPAGETDQPSFQQNGTEIFTATLNLGYGEDFSGRTIMEGPGRPPGDRINSCDGSSPQAAFQFAPSLTITGNNTYDDRLGMHQSAIDAGRNQGVFPCGFTMYQSIQMACTYGEGGFWTNEIDQWLVDYFDETLTKNGASVMLTGYNIGP